VNNLLGEDPHKGFDDFIAPGADRFELLRSRLEKLKLSPRILNTGGKRHIAAGIPSMEAGRPLLIAHYDRSANSPGANDNSAAVFILIEAALRMRDDRAAPGAAPRIIFTDKEELSGGQKLEEQGSYSLALYLKEQGLGASRVFCFDACGAGDTLIISTAADHLLKNEDTPGAETVRRRIQELREAALEAAREARLDRVLLLPTPFSDDAGFLKAGISAQTITVLPAPEAAAFASLSRTKPEIIRAILSSSAPHTDRRLIPETWRSLNGPGDSPLRLTKEHWGKVAEFAQALAYRNM
jgi:hypothetical protein